MTKYENALAIVRRGWALTAIGMLGLVGVYVRAIWFTPADIRQGPAHKILYLHAPAAWATLLGFAVTGILSVLYLWFRNRKLDTIAAASAEVGVTFGVLMLVTGVLWGKGVWGAWWAWDARLTSTSFLFLLFVGYLVLRGALMDQETRARFGAVLGVLAVVLVPFIYLTVYMFRTHHPDPVLLRASGPSMPGSMLVTLLLSICVYTVLYVGFLMQRYAISVLEDVREEEVAHALS